MMKNVFAAAALAASFFATSAQAATFTASASFAGDLCATDGNGSGGFDDCATITGNTGSQGIQRFSLTDLNLDIQSDVTIRLTSTAADLFNTNGTDNSIERFRLIVGGQNFGRLFDNNSADEAAINAGLATSVQQNIANNIARPVANRSAGPIDVSFLLTSTQFLGLVSGTTLNVDLDFRQDQNINQFSDPTVSVSYTVPDAAVVPLPASSLLLVAGIGGLVAMRRRKKA